MKLISTILLVCLVFPFLGFGQDTLTTEKRYFKQYLYQNGKTASEGYLKNEKPDGFWKSWYVSGVKKSEGTWKNFLLDSIWVFYDEIGDTVEKVSYLNGKKSGYDYKYFKDDNAKNIVQSKELYVNGKKNGNMYYYFPNEKIQKVIPFLDDKKNGLSYEFDADSVIITITRYRENDVIYNEEINRYNNKKQKQGVWKTFDTTGKIKEERTYLNGKLNGYLKQYDDMGFLVNTVRYENDEIVLKDENYNLDIQVKEEYDQKGNQTFQGGYLKDIPVGTHRYFNAKGQVIKSETFDIKGELESEGIVFVDGTRHGKWTDYYPGKKVKSNGNYKNNLKDGLWTFYYVDGKIQQKGNYTNGKMTGNWKWYHKNGMLLLDENYSYGLTDGESIEYSEDGQVVDSGFYSQGYKEGEWITRVGDMILKGKFVMGQKDGIWQQFYSTRELYFEGRYVQGNTDGKHVYYYPNGSILEERYYSEGQKVKSWIKYKPTGEMLLVVQYKDGREYKINGEKIRFDKFD
ncbi:MAG: toxin-antitoxin system YwqK family antitoxin [Bacteroidales bacterium]